MAFVVPRQGCNKTKEQEKAWHRQQEKFIGIKKGTLLT